MLHGKNTTEKTNCEAEGDNLSLSFSWYETAVHTKDLKPCGQLFEAKVQVQSPYTKLQENIKRPDFNDNHKTSLKPYANTYY